MTGSGGATINSCQFRASNPEMVTSATSKKKQVWSALFQGQRDFNLMLFNISELPWRAIRRTNNAAALLSRNHKTLNITFKTNRLSSHCAGQPRWSRLSATAHINNTTVRSIVPSPPPLLLLLLCLSSPHFLQ